MKRLDRLVRSAGRETGIALVEVLMAALVAGVAVTGLALMLGKGNAWVAAGGDNRVAAKLAEQKLEQLRSLTFKCVFPGGPQSYPTGATGGPQDVQAGCQAAAGSQNYNEGPGNNWKAANGTTGPQPAPSVSMPNHTFTRKTCVQYVTDGSTPPQPADFSLPPYLGGTNPTTGNCQPFVNATTTPATSCSTLSGTTCVATNTKRIVVVVQPTNSAGLSRQESESAAILEAWLTNIPGGL